MQQKPQMLAEAVIPVLGYYYWDWSWYFILLFYSLDGISKEIILNLQSRKIYQTQGGENAKKQWISSALISISLNVVIVAVLHVALFLNSPQFNVTQEIFKFLSHKEMGIPQGFILLPLIALSVAMPYKMQFLKFNLHQRLTISQLWSVQLSYRLFVFFVACIGLVITFFFHPKDYHWLWAAVTLPFLYQSVFKKSKLV